MDDEIRLEAFQNNFDPLRQKHDALCTNLSNIRDKYKISIEEYTNK